MPRKIIACPKCGRRFKMAAHLGRHMTTMHGAGRAKRGIGQAVTAIGHGITEGMHGLIDRLHAMRNSIAKQRDHLAHQLEAIGRAIAELGEKPGPTARRHVASRAVSRRHGRAARGTVILAILRTLDEHGPIKPAKVAQRSGAKPTSTSVALDKLKKKKLAVRSDKGWSLTAAGRGELTRR